MTVSTAHTWEIEVEVGEHGIDVGGAIHLMPEPFWGWSPPQDQRPDRLGFTTARTNAPGVTLESNAGGGLFMATVRGRALEPGERVTLVYGEGQGALSDRHRDREARIWISVDADGDGVRQVLESSPRIEVVAGTPAMLVALGPSIVRPGEAVSLHVSVLDALANRGIPIEGRLWIEDLPEGWSAPESVALADDRGGTTTIQVVCGPESTGRLSVRLESEELTLSGVTPPIVVSTDLPCVRWADLHGHSGLSDGTGTPEDWYAYARDVARLDAAALTDHDHFGVQFLDENPGLWERIRAATLAAHRPDEFVTIPAFEWTSWIHGHRHVLHFADEAPLISSLDPRTERPDQLWDALRGMPALTIAHHSSGNPIPTNWTFRPDPVLEPVTEVASVHGSSEAGDGPRPVRGSRQGRYVRDVLDRGNQLGFIASGDGHDGHPGLAHASPLYGALQRPDGSSLPGQGGLAAIWSEELTRTGLLEALRAKRTVATSGPRSLAFAWLDQQPPGSPVREESPGSVELRWHGTSPLRLLEVIRDGEVVRVSCPVGLDLQHQFPLPGGPLRVGDYAYLRITQEDGAVCWTSPWFGQER